MNTPDFESFGFAHTVEQVKMTKMYSSNASNTSRVHQEGV